jgi:PKD repeat protein
MNKLRFLVGLVVGLFLISLSSLLSPLPAASHATASGPDPPFDARTLSITLVLFAPEYGECGDISINGYVGTDSGSITKLTWDWKDGTVVDSWFPASHHYAGNGTYSVQVTAYSSLGDTRTVTTTATITNAEDLGCRYTVRLHPAPVVLREGHITKTLRLEIRGAEGELISPIGRQVLFTSTNPSLVQVDASGVVTSTGFGEAEIEVAVQGIPRQATAQVVAGHWRIEPPILLLSPTDEPTVTLTLDVANADGTAVNLSGHSITFSGGNSVASVSNEGIVTALSPPQQFWDSPYISAQFDGQGANNAAFTRVTTNTLGLMMRRYRGEHTLLQVADQVGSYPYGQLMGELQAVKVSDAAYLLEQWLTGATPNNGDLQFLVMDPGYDLDGTVPCGLAGNPLRLGVGVDNYRSCLGGEDWLQWGVMYHEMGHNFMQQRSFSELIAGLPNSGDYSEGMATMLGEYAIDRLISNPAAYGLTVTTTQNLALDWIPLTPNFARNVFYDKLTTYEAAPDYANDFDADILDGIMTKLHDQYGLAFLYRFFSTFVPPGTLLDIAFAGEGQRLAFWVAACSVAANQDLLMRFRDDWDFPVDEAFYVQVYPQAQRLVAQRDPTADAGEDRTIPVGQSYRLDDAYAFDWEGDPMTFTWQMISKPPDSAASLFDSTTLHPSFRPDKPGTYVLSLTTSDGFITGAADTVSILAEGEPASGTLGDVNTDDLVDSTDALIVLSADAGLNTSQFCPMNCGDTNADGLVNSTDALIVLSYDAGLSVPFPVGQPGCPPDITQPPGCTP